MLFIIKACLMLLFLNSYCFIHMFETTIPKCSEITAAIATGAMCLRLLVNGTGFKQVKKTIIPMLVFWNYCFAVGVVLELFDSYQISLVYPILEKILIIALVSYVIYNDKSPKFVLNLCITVATATAISTLIKTENLYVRTELSDGMSSNLIGMVCASGILCLSMSQSRFYNRYIKLGLNVLFLSSIIVTASRQSLIMSILIYLSSWMISILNKKNKTRGRLISDMCFIVIIGIIASFFINNGYLDVIYETKLYARVTGVNKATMISDTGRLDLYVNGWKLFWERPVLGIGFDYVKYVYAYTHSTFIELLVGTGIIGFLIFFIPYFKRMIAYVVGAFREKNSLQKKYYVAKVVIGGFLFVMMLTREILNYTFCMVIWTLFIADYNFAEYEK